VTGILKTTEKNLMVFSGRAHPELAEEVARLLGTGLVPTSAYDFANGEIYVRYEESVRGSDAFVIQSHTAPLNEAIMEQLIMIDALKRASAKRITVVLPFYGYARQDKKHRGREPISARLMADLFKTAGANRLMAVDLHTAQIQGFFDGPVDHLMALPILSDYVREKYGNEKLAVVSPDAGRIKVAEQWSERLGGAPLAFIHKTRDINRPNETVANRVVGEVKGRICVLVDDMIDTGGTITKAADALMADGAAGVVIAATHAILSGPAVKRLNECAADEVIVTNTLPIDESKQFDKLTVLSIAPLISRAIQEVFEDGSVTSLFDGHASSGSGGLALPVGRDVRAVPAPAVAVPLGAVLAEVDDHVLAVVRRADAEPRRLAGPDDVDQGHRHLDRHPRRQGGVRRGGVQVPRPLAVADQLGHSLRLGEQGVDHGHRVVGVSDPHGTQAWAQRADRLELGAVVLVRPAQLPLADEPVEVLDRGEVVGVRGQGRGGVDERCCSAQRHFRVMGEKHLDS
jgi:ribose-phosphate pyrophosphokinase